MALHTFTCPHCHSDETSSFQMIYTGSASERNGNQDILIQQTARPFPPPDGSKITVIITIFVAIFLVAVSSSLAGIIDPKFTFVGSLGGLAASLLLGITLFMSAKRKYRNRIIQWQDSLLVWQKSWMCLKCGHDWQTES
jgi:hypothetical protein